MRHALAVTKTLDLAILPAEALAMEADCFVVVDVLRATTTIATLFARRLESLVAVDNIDRARALAKAEGRLLFGEVDGLPPPGFDFGNSPAEAAAADVAGRGAVLFTTNGTTALCALAGRGVVATGAIVNTNAVAGYVSRFDRVVLVCAGRAGGRRFALDDFATAGLIIQRLVRLNPGIETGDAAGVAMTSPGYEDWLASALPQQTGRSARLIAGSAHGRDLTSIGLGGDINFAMQEDWSQAVPLVVESAPGEARLIDAARASDR